MSDLISRQAAIDAMTNTLWHYPNECYRNLNEYEFAKGLAEIGLKSVPSAQPEREVARMVIGKSKGGVTLWSECNKCGEPVDPYDNFCRNCGRRFVIDE